MGRKRGAPGAGDEPEHDDDDAIEFVPAGSLPPPQSSGPLPGAETDAERKTEDLWERMLGVDNAGTGYITVHRSIGGAGSSEEFVEKIPSDKYDYDSLLEYLRDNYGGGDYRVRLYVMNPRGNYVMRGNRMASIAKRTAGAPVAAAARDIAVRGGNADMATVLATFDAMQQRSQQQMEAMMERMMKRMEPAVVQPQKNSALEFVEILTALTAAITPIATLVVQTRKKEPDPFDSLTKVLAMTGQIKALTPEQQAAEAEPVWAGILKEAVKALPHVMAARAGQQRLALPNKAPVAQRPVRGPAVPPQPPLDDMAGATTVGVGDDVARAAQDGEEVQGEGFVPTDRTLGDQNHPLHPILCDLLDAAKSGADPAEVAHNVIENADPMQRTVVGQFLAQDGLVKELAAIHPDVLDEVDWVLDLRDEVLTLLEGAEEGYAPDTSDDSGSDNGAGD